MEESRGEASKPAVPFLLGVERGLEALGERLPWALLPDGLDHHLLLHRRRHPLPAASGRVGRRGAAGRRIWLYGGGGDQITDLVEETRGGGARWSTLWARGARRRRPPGRWFVAVAGAGGAAFFSVG